MSGRQIKAKQDFCLPKHLKHFSEIRFQYNFLSLFLVVLFQQAVVMLGYSDI
jgi:hypothetical protein